MSATRNISRGEEILTNYNYPDLKTYSEIGVEAP